MSVARNSLEGGTDGTTITTGNSGGASGTAFDVVTIGTSSTLTFDAAQASRGLLSAKYVTPAATPAATYTGWTTAIGTLTVDCYFRFYLYLTANPSAVNRVLNFLNGAAIGAGLEISATGKLITKGIATISTSTNSVTLNQWVRIEGWYRTGTTGTLEVKLFNSPASITPTETISGNATAGLTQWTAYRFGMPGATPEASYTMRLDEIACGDNGSYFGPAAGREMIPTQFRPIPFIPQGRAI